MIFQMLNQSGIQREISFGHIYNTVLDSICQFCWEFW